LATADELVFRPRRTLTGRRAVKGVFAEEKEEEKEKVNDELLRDGVSVLKGQ
jgi:hypothetical protein